MDSGAALRRSTRSAAKRALYQLRNCATGSDAAAAAGTSTAKRRTIRGRTHRTAEPPAENSSVSNGTVSIDTKRSAAGKRVLTAGPGREYEEELWQQGFANVAGVDEAGRGPLAGPVVAAACIIPAHVSIEGIDDSKKLNEEQREGVYALLTAHPDIRWATQVVEAGEIDSINILQAALKAMEGAATGLPTYDYLLVDGNRLPKGFDPSRSKTLVKGDSKSYAIAAASIIAKVTRDRLMDLYHQKYPQYNFQQHKGYGVPAHIEAIRQHGPCPIHRRSFAPIKHWFPVPEIKK